MHLLFFSAQYPPTVGGVERYTQSLAATLVGMGHSATVATSALPGLPPHETGSDGVEVYRLPAFLPMRGRFPVVRQNTAFRTLAAQMWTTSYDFAVINTRFYPLSLWAARQCHRRGVPALVLEHGTKHLSLDNALLDQCANLYEHVAMQRVRRYCDNIYGVSLACNEWLCHFGVEARGVLYNAVDPQRLRQAAASGRDFRAILGIAPKAPLVVFSGRFIREKGVYELLAAFARLRQSIPDAVLVMAGDGPEYTAFAQNPAPGVYLTGQLPYEDNLALVAQADVFCLPTYSEGFSASVLESAALETFIITTRTGGSPELISDSESGILLEGSAPESISRAMERALRDSAFRQSAARAAFEKLCAHFTWDATAKALINIVQEEDIHATADRDPRL